jgi:hypothetical protein
MTYLNLLKLTILTAVIVGAAPLTLAQSTGDGSMGRHAHAHNNPQWQACKQQADDKKLARGAARKSFMQDCIKAAGGDATPKPAT